MHLIVQHTEGVITSVRLAPVVAQLRRSVPVAADQAKLAAYMAANAGKTVLVSEFEKATHRYEQRLLLVIDGSVVDYPVNTLVIAANKLTGGATFLIDLLQNWTTGKYRVTDDKILIAPDWQEPILLLAPTDDPLAP